MDTQVTVVLIIACLAFSAFFSCTETAFFALQRVRLQHLVEQGRPLAKRVQRMKEHPERFLATILLGNNLVNTATATLATTLAIDALGSDNEGTGVIIATAVTTVVLVILAEALPKAVGARVPEQVAFLFIRPLEVVEVVLSPVAGLLHRLSSFVTRPLMRGAAPIPLVSQEEMRMLVSLGAREGTMEQAQADIISKAFRLADLRAQEIMTPRTEIVWVEQGWTLGEFLKFYAKETHNRFPVYEGEQDNVVGVLDVRNVLKAVAEGSLREEDGIAPLLRPASFYPETKLVHDLLVAMRSRGEQMAMLVDEFGGIAGLLTIKQIAGEIVGRMSAEGAEEVKTIDEQTVQVDAGMRIDEANERLGLALPEGDYDTLAGFILTRLGRIPRVGEELHHDGVRLVVSEMKGVKIERVLVQRK